MQYTAIVLSEESNNAKVFCGSDLPSVIFKNTVLVKSVSIGSIAKAFSNIQYDIEMPMIISKIPPINVVKITTVKNKVIYQVICDEFKTVVKYNNKADRNNGIDETVDYKVITPKGYWTFAFDEAVLLSTRLYHFGDYIGDKTLLYRFSIGNANPEVCWGDYKSKIAKSRPKHIQGIISQFWSSVFNDDLTTFDPKNVFFTRGSLDTEYIINRITPNVLEDSMQSLINNL